MFARFFLIAMMLSSVRHRLFKQYCLTWHVSLFLLSLSIVENSVAQTQIVIAAPEQGKFHFETVSPSTKSGTFTVDFPLHTTVLVNAKTSIAYLFSPQGWILVLDLEKKQLRQQSRITSQISAMAISEYGDYLMLANDKEHTLLAVQSENLQLVRCIAMRNTAGQVSRIASLHHAAPRQSFIAVMRDFPELWEMSYNSNAEPVYQGLVHDYQMGEGIADKNLFAPRKTVFEFALHDFAFDRNFSHAIGADELGNLQIINLNIRRKIFDMALVPPVHPNQAEIKHGETGSLLYLPAKEKSESDEIILVLEMKSGRIVQRLPLASAKPTK